MHEGLREVSAQLALEDVVLLGVQTGRAASGPVTLEPTCSRHVVALLGVGQREDETAQQERTLCRPERLAVDAIAIGVVVRRQFRGVGGKSRGRP